MFNFFRRFNKKDKGQAMVEYVFILALISIVAIGGLSGVGGKVSDTFGSIFDGSDSIVGGGTENITDEEIEDLVKQGYIIVANPEDLQAVGNGEKRTWGIGTKWEQPAPAPAEDNHMGAKFIQVQDIDMSGFGSFEPIGSLNNSFKGTFDGGGYTVSKLSINNPNANYQGLFGAVDNALIENVGLVDVSINGNYRVGGLIGSLYESSVKNSYVTGEVTGTDEDIGGLVGNMRGYSSLIDNSYTTSKVTGSNFVGGLVGYMVEGPKTTNSYATGEVTGSNSVGGLVGIMWGSEGKAKTTNSYATGKVKGDRFIGGLVGSMDNSFVIDSYGIGDVTGDTEVGGLVGSSQKLSEITNSYATGVVTGRDDVGGLVGIYDKDLSVNSSYYDMDTTGKRGVGIGTITSHMKEQSTYVGWDFGSIWTIESGQYPTLQWQ